MPTAAVNRRLLAKIVAIIIADFFGHKLSLSVSPFFVLFWQRNRHAAHKQFNELFHWFLAVEATNDTMEEGKDATLGCQIEGDLYTNAKPSWYREEDTERKDELKNSTKYMILDKNGTLTIKKAGNFLLL